MKSPEFASTTKQTSTSADIILTSLVKQTTKRKQFLQKNYANTARNLAFIQFQTHYGLPLRSIESFG